MAITQNTYVGNGSTVLYSFTFPYLKTADIKVTLNGAPTTAYTLANATTLQFNSPPANGAAVRIYRDTDVDALSATFFSGSTIRATDLNNNFLQSIYSGQEVRSRNLDPASAVFQGNVDLGGYRIVNTANGVNPNDGVNKSQLDATQNYNDSQLQAAISSAQGHASVAQGFSNSAQAASQASANSAQQSSQSASTAASSAQTASSWASTASAAASAAANSATTAAAFAGNTIFFGFSRTQTGNLILTWSTPAENTSYSTAGYEYKNGSQWYIGSNDVLHSSGPSIGQPKVSFNASGHLILTA